ncbi:MAG TPA: methylated-DNA--[protein]-cysteine S-methyltransferase [Actinophytocola sp.]|uniref:methylated-DNA--[protein]-cysteine S-methyltransferase n=1 Tax=Actinophytocola sp. TaxID=1872138 RepID=UPI002DDD588F|nr:methylated-DNA--[protein]-cysteine S-methyltransferase [Actinophytocola sp.]HEV2782368.1 methylated-DNA--[protein]-cysteine S-methyltransferase [Actinophytocola sp.]
MTDTIAFGSLPTEVGDVLVGVTELGVAATGFGDSPEIRFRIARRLGLPAVRDPARTTPVIAELAGYFAGTLRQFTVDIDWRSLSATRRQVLHTLHSQVPYGEVVTYGGLARLTPTPTPIPARTIGTIMATNPIPIIVPCHRVVAGDGLGGFSAGDGVESKRHLLTLEGHLPPTLF